MAGTQGKNLEAGAEAEPTKEHYLLACSYDLPRLLSYRT